MQDQRSAHVIATPPPRAFRPEPTRDDAHRIEAVGRAVDDVVGWFLQAIANEAGPQDADLRRLAAASRRLWMQSTALLRTREEHG